MRISPQYLAGLIDGEGCIMVSRGKRLTSEHKRGYQFSPVMTIANTNVPLLVLVQQDYGGKIRVEHHDTYAVYFSAYEIRELLPIIMPYLILKKREAGIMLRFLERKSANGPRPLSDENYLFYTECYTELRRLKKIRHTYDWSPKFIRKDNCKVCQKELEVYSNRPQRRYCSEFCRRKSGWTKSNARIRAGVPAWTGIETSYYKAPSHNGGLNG